jgi:hypothetical protein
MAEIRIIPTAQQYVESFNAAVDIVARERKYLISLGGPPLETTRRFIAHLLGGGGNARKLDGMYVDNVFMALLTRN